MTQEQKAQRYDEAIDIARKINSGEGVAAPSGWTTCEVIFPELKESKDEKIRKALLRFHKSTIDIDGIKGGDILAWLEKQGEHANFRNKIQIGDKVTRNEDGVLVNLSQLKRIAKKDEKQGEQSTIDKVEPKFKVGDWVVQENNGVYKVIKVRESWYEVANNKDCSIGFISFNKEYICHRWTIQDAKDGDVLVCPKYAGDIIPNIFIFKNIERKDNDVFCHCSFLEKFRTEGYVANADPINTDFYPATKEQRDTLMKAIADAGYTFDFEKKELRKIEQKQKWSEEDERNLNDAILFIETGTYSLDKDNLINWLKSLRPQNRWKPSEEQMNILFKYAEQNNKDGSILTSLYQDLKRLKGRESD